MRKWTSALPVVASFALSAAVFSRMPMAARPDFSAVVPLDLPPSGPVGRVEAALLFPMVALVVWLLLTRLAKVRAGRAPLPEWLLNENTDARSVRRFEPTYETITFGITALVLILHAGFLAGMLGLPPWSFQILTGFVGLGMMAIGNVMPRTRPNWIAGVRTRRTLSDPVVWAKTHRLAGILMMVAGSIVIATSIVAPAYALVAAIVLPLISLAVATYPTTRMETQCLT